jgi:hypothetical protein
MRHALRATIAVPAAALALAACGSSSRTTTSGESSPGSFAAFASCMRSHGVPNFPDSSGPGGIHFSPGSGIDPAAPAFRQAQARCQKLLPGGGPPRKVSEHAKTEMLAVG